MRSLYDMAKTRWGKLGVLALMLVCIIVWTWFWNYRADATHVVPGGGGTYSWTAHKAHRQVRHHQLRPMSAVVHGHYVHGHAVCKRGYYPVVSKYTGLSCASHKSTKKVAHDLVDCGVDTFIGWIFGAGLGAGAGLAGCSIHKIID